MQKIKFDIASKIAEVLNKEANEIFDNIEIPKDSNMGDFAYPCFKLSKELRKSPVMIAEELKTKIEKEYFIKILRYWGRFCNSLGTLLFRCIKDATK